MPPRERDSRGRFISNRDEPIDETNEIFGPIEIPRTSESREDPSEIQLPGRYFREVPEEDRDPSEQLQEELLARMASSIPQAQEAKPIRLVQFDIPNLTKQNVRTWKSDVKEFCETQGVWKVVQETLKRQGNPEELRRILDNPIWASQDATARLYIKRNIQLEDKTSVRDLNNSGAVWRYLMTRYERTTQYDVIIALRKVTLWKKDPQMDLETSLQQLEQLNAELYEISNKQQSFNELMILTMFLDGLPDEYEGIRDSLFGNTTLERGLILSRLQQKELKSNKTEDNSGETTGESANRAKQGKCFNCGKPGHFARDCRAPKKEEEKKDHSRSRHRGEDRYKRKDRGAEKDRRRKAKGKARSAEEDSGRSSESESDRDSKTSREEAYRIHLDERISDQFEHLLDEKACRAKGSQRHDPIIDSGATSTCSGDIEFFESLDQRYTGSLGTAGKSMKIAGKGTIRIPLSSGKKARISDALYVPGMKQTLLSTQALYADKIWNQHVRAGYQFFRKKSKTIATGYNIGRTSYLGWVERKDSLITRSQDNEKEYARLIKEVDWKLLHQRLGHPGETRFKQIIKKMRLVADKKAIDALKTCETCIQAKSQKKQNHEPVSRASRPLKRVYMDFWGPYNKAEDASGKRWRYYLSLTDDCTRFSWIYLTKDREAATVKRILEIWIAQAEREKGVQLLVIRTDNAREFKALQPWALEKGIRIEFTEPYTPAQNGVAERLNRFLLEVTRAILIGSDVPKEYWPYAVKMANYIRNRTIRVQGTKKSPFELWFGHPPDISKFRTPFCRVWFHKKTNDKMEARAVEGVFMGYESSKNHYNIMAVKNRKIYRVTNPIFLENKRGFITREPGSRDIGTEAAYWKAYGGNITLPSELGSGGGSSVPKEAEIRPAGSAVAAGIDSEKEIEDEVEDEVISEESLDMGEGGRNIGSENIVNQNPDSDSPAYINQSTPPSTSELRQSSRIRKPTTAAIESKQSEQIYGRKPRAQRRQEAREEARSASYRRTKHEQQRIHEVANLAVALELYLGDQDEFAFKAIAKPNELIPIPESYQEAINDPIYGSKWREAVKLELNNLIRFGTWRYVKRPRDHVVVSTKWVFDVKRSGDGRIDRFKARLVARGFSQREGLDFEDTFAPVIRLESLRILFAIAASYGLQAHLLDATNAYVGSKIDKQIYMEIPEGIDPKSHDPKDVCEILQSLYGLRQSAYLWNQKVKKFVTSIGFQQSTADPGVFINDRGVIIALYVDDILIFSKSTKDIESTKDQLKRFHPMKDLGLATKILGIRITWKKNSIQLDQQFYAQSILEEFGMMNAKPQAIPLSPSIDLNDTSSRKLPQDLHAQFRQIIGRLTYLAGGTRLDIQFTVNRLSQHLADPRDIHHKASKHLLRYIKATIHYRISYRKDCRTKGSDLLTGYSDSSYGNATKYRSTSAYIFTMAEGPISWCSRKQPITATSTTEAEYIAAAEAAKHAIWIKHFLFSIRKGLKGPVQLGIDNQGALALASNPVNHLRSKHIRIRYHAIRDYIEHGDITTIYIPTSEMLADGLTKAIKSEGLNRMAKTLRLDE
jgi:hypothetical protein